MFMNLSFDSMQMQVHNIVGIGDLTADTPTEKTGQIFDIGASPNDPIFIVHHIMVDCIFDEWLSRHPDQGYPQNVPLTLSTQGHRANDYMVPFFPLYTNADMFKPAAENFGYSCNLPNLGNVDSGDSQSTFAYLHGSLPFS